MTDYRRMGQDNIETEHWLFTPMSVGVIKPAVLLLALVRVFLFNNTSWVCAWGPMGWHALQARADR